MSVFGRYELHTLLDLLSAAALCPGTAHRLPTIAFAIHRAVVQQPRGSCPARESDLGTVLEACWRFEPRLETLEDYIPVDPALPAHFPLDGSLFRVHPASLERPIAAIDRALFVSTVTDPILRQSKGFGIRDLIELVLRYIHATVSQHSRHWTTKVAESIGAPAAITRAEVLAVTDLPSIDTSPDSCSDPEASRTALDWGTVNPPNLALTVGTADSSLGTALAVRFPDRLWPLPAPFLLESALSAAGALAEESHRLSPDCDLAFRRGVAERARLALMRFGQVLVDVDVRSPKRLFCLLPASHAHWLAVDLACSLRMSALQRDIAQASSRLQSVSAGGQYWIRPRGVDSSVTLPPTANLVRLLVVGSPRHLFLRGPPGLAQVTLDDLDWIRRTADDRDDLFLFCRDLVSLQAGSPVLLWESIDAWEVWRQNGKAFHRAGVSMGAFCFAPHAGDAEWKVAVEQASVERALAAVGLSPLRTWDHYELASGCARLLTFDPPNAWAVLVSSCPVAVRLVNESVAPEVVHFADPIAQSLLWTVERLQPILVLACDHLGIQGVRVYLEMCDVQALPPVDFLGLASDRAIRIGCRSNLATYAEENPGSTEHLLGDALVAGLHCLRPADGSHQRILDDLARAWREAPRSFSIESERVPQVRTDLPAPQMVHPGFASDALREVAQKLVEAGVREGALSGDQAKQLESALIYPTLRDRLVRMRSRWSGRELVLQAASELECAVSQRLRLRHQLASNVRSMAVEFDAYARATEIEKDGGLLSRAIQLVIETALATADVAAGTIDRLDWRAVVSTAMECIDSAMRGEAICYEIQPGEIHISETYEVEFKPSGAGPIDLEAFHRDRAELAFEPDQGQLPSDRELTIDEDIDRAFHDSHGFHVRTLLRVLVSLRGWPLGREDPPIAVASVEELLAFLGWATELPTTELLAAVSGLTLNGEDLDFRSIEPWESGRRVVRLMTRPIVGLASDTRVVLPWFVGESLAVYIRYLKDGRLPWPRRLNAEPLRDALSAYRQRRNTALEDEVAHVIRDAGMPVKTRVKKAKTIGLEQLTGGEIDAIVLDPQLHVIWILEVKDPEEPFSISEIERGVRRFFSTDGWVAKLERKVNDIRTNPALVASSFGVQSESPWNVRGLVVTRRPVPAAFHRAPRMPFTTVTRCVAFLLGTRADGDP